MDIATIVGLIAAFGLIYMAIAANAPAFIDTASCTDCCGWFYCGGDGALLAWESFWAQSKSWARFFQKIDDPVDLITQIVELANIARKDGMIALEGQEISNPFLAKAVAMLVDGTDGEIIKSSLNRDNTMMKLRHSMGANIFSAWGEIAPAMGMIGTLAGLVIMLGNMSDPKAIGPAMAVALLTTMYGAILANVICLPIAQKLENASSLEAANNELIIEGVLFMQEGGNPRVLADMLASFVSPKSREKLSTA